MKSWIKRLLCWHYWDEGKSIDPVSRFTMREFHCIKCKKRKVKLWNWGIEQNILKYPK